jgi:hypothetical protein
MSVPSCSIVCATARLAWCMSTTHDPAAYVVPSTVAGASSTRTFASLATRCRTRRTAAASLACPPPRAMT